MIPNATTIKLLVGSLTAVGIAIPKDAAEWLLLTERLAANLDRPTEDLQAAAASLKTEGVDTIVDSLVRERVEASARTLVVNELIEVASANAVRAIRTKGDSLIAKARIGFDKHARIILEHAPAYSPDQPASDVLDSGTASAAAWTAIRDASAALDAYVTMRSNLYGVPANADSVVASYHGDWWKRVDGSQDFDTRERWHRLARRGLNLRLNTHAEALALEAATPEQELRSETSYEGGVTRHAQVR